MEPQRNSNLLQAYELAVQAHSKVHAAREDLIYNDKLIKADELLQQVRELLDEAEDEVYGDD